MKIVYVIDSVNNFNQKIDLIKNRFGNDILYVTHGSIVPLVKSYGIEPNAVYSKNLSKIVHLLLAQSPTIEDTIICYSSLAFNNELLNKFIEKIKDGSKVVNLKPSYNNFEKFGHAIYNVYAKSLFKMKDHLASTKLQYLPKEFVVELLNSHFGNRLFEIEEELTKDVYIQDKEINKSAKAKVTFTKKLLVPIIIALAITALFFIGLTYLKSVYLVVLMFIFLLLTDILLCIIFLCKDYFDKRFFR